ncbi:RNA methyltransferase [Facilibium subflavum]|uniref:RNA methyltransferase n=1 Tax=Facilibium subflavum TaxID=2219058 RepID=UPI000E65581D|nr:RNA methyltransferase [Facilibium subflavum]
MLDKIRIVLVETSHMGNIGSAARAMMNMSLSQLYLVNPKQQPDDHAHAVAAHADALVKNAHVVTSLEEALEGVALVIGTSARTRRMDLPLINVKSAAQKSIEKTAQGGEVAIVFGRERTGLYNNELLMCHIHAYIPTNEVYNSLNLAQAVQVFCYELYSYYIACDQKVQLPAAHYVREKASAKELLGFYQHLEEKLIATGFLNPDKPGHVVDKLKRLFQRAQLESQEVNILRGFLSHIPAKNSSNHKKE